MTLQDLKKAAELKGWEIETHVLEDSLEDGHPFSQRITEVGICKGRGVWIWYKFREYADDNSEYFDRIQIYSQNTGNIYKGLMKFIDFENQVEKIINKQ